MLSRALSAVIDILQVYGRCANRHTPMPLRPCLSTIATSPAGQLLRARSAPQNRAAERNGGPLSASSVVNDSSVTKPVTCEMQETIRSLCLRVFSAVLTVGSSLQAPSQAAGVSMLTLVMVGDSSRKTAGQSVGCVGTLEAKQFGLLPS